MKADPNVVAIVTGVPKVVPPLVDFATNKFWLPVSGQKAKTSPLALVLISLPMAVPVVSLPLICCGELQVPPGPWRTATKQGALLCQMRYSRIWRCVVHGLVK